MRKRRRADVRAPRRGEGRERPRRRRVHRRRRRSRRREPQRERALHERREARGDHKRRREHGDIAARARGRGESTTQSPRHDRTPVERGQGDSAARADAPIEPNLRADVRDVQHELGGRETVRRRRRASVAIARGADEGRQTRGDGRGLTRGRPRLSARSPRAQEDLRRAVVDRDAASDGGYARVGAGAPGPARGGGRERGGERADRG
mmetsp:Transcript_11279/g.40724  ORF Transcript_11279/g.40724 Transcript_11279/m.40724 type:complete len:208 (+) Transcript_11279:1972-2595(+)